MTESGPDFWDLSCGNMCDISVEMEKKKKQKFCSTLTPIPHWPVVGSLGKRAARPSVVITTLAAAPRSAQSAEGKAAGALLICAVKKKKPRQRNCRHLRVSNDVWARITFSLRHGDINSWDTLLNQTLYSAHGSCCCCCCKCREVWEWCFCLAWMDMKTV